MFKIMFNYPNVAKGGDEGKPEGANFIDLFKNWSNKKKVFLYFGFLFLFLFCPFSALAFWETIKNAVLFVPYAIISLYFIYCIVVSQGFAWLTGYILDIVMSPSFISLSYTNPAANQIIASGLSITQSFVNLILVLALVYTALAITLRYQETEAKKILARLIIVALLVNFAPVFCGLVVDATNIAMYYFLKPMEGGVSGVLTQIGPHVDRVIQTIWEANVDLPKRLGVIMMAVTQIMLNIGMGIAFLLFAALFLMRYVVIWILTILSPLAFVFWILPQTRKFWTMWFDQFIQWSIIGIPIAFFLYLAMGSFSLMTAAFKAKIEMPGIEAPAVGFFNEVFPYFVVIVFLFLGFGIGLKTGAMGAAGVIRGFQAAHKTAQKRTLGGVGRGVGRGAAAPVRATVAEVGRIRETYKSGRGFGLSRTQAAGETAKVYWQKRIKPGATAVKEGIKHPIATGKKIGKATLFAGKATMEREGKAFSDLRAGKKPGTRGFVNALGDVIATGWKAAKMPSKKSKKRPLTKEEKKKIEEGREIEVETPEEE